MIIKSNRLVSYLFLLLLLLCFSSHVQIANAGKRVLEFKGNVNGDLHVPKTSGKITIKGKSMVIDVDGLSETNVRLRKSFRPTDRPKLLSSVRVVYEEVARVKFGRKIPDRRYAGEYSYRTRGHGWLPSAPDINYSARVVFMLGRTGCKNRKENWKGTAVIILQTADGGTIILNGKVTHKGNRCFETMVGSNGIRG